MLHKYDSRILCNVLGNVSVFNRNRGQFVKSFWLRAVALPTLIASPAVAADLPIKAPPSPPVGAYDWSGFYVGLNAGGDRAYSGDPTTSASCASLPQFFSPYFACNEIPTVNAAGTGSMSGSGFTGGAQAGYNWQFNSLVVGAEGDFESFYGKASRTGTGTFITNPLAPPFQPMISSSVDANWLATARGRVGWAFNNLLVYGTGGLAVTRLSASNSYSDNVSPAMGTWSASATRAGWAAGAGIEWAFNQHWSARAEYLYVHFDAITASGFVTTSLPGFAYGSAISTSTDLSASIARAGINYKF